MKKSQSCYKRLTWKLIRKEISHILPDFAKIIDKLEPNEDYPLYQVQYPYGSLLTDNGVFQIPNSAGNIVAVNHPSIPNEVKNDLEYTETIPLGLVTKKGIETFIQLKNKTIPGTFKRVGEFVSLWRIFEEEKYSYHLNWTITSGARSICMIPKITDYACHKVLKKKYDLPYPIAENLFDQWDIFSHISNHQNFSQPWSSELIFFSKKWFENKNDPSWNEFYRFLLDQLCKGSSFRRSQIIFDSAFSMIQQNRNLKPNPYISDMVRHLIAITSGTSPAFTPAIDDSTAPISGLQKVYIEDYGLKKYAPVIMHLQHFKPTSKPVYYSFQMPTIPVFSPKARKASSIMVELQELKYIMEILFAEISQDNLGLAKTPLALYAKNVIYNYFHSDKDKQDEILPISDIQFDSAFTRSIINETIYPFPEFGPFLRGCISISNLV